MERVVKSCCVWNFPFHGRAHIEPCHTRQQMWRVSLLAVDAIQVAVLALRVDYGWSARWFGWLQNMSLLGWLMPYAEPEWYNIVYGVVVLMVWVALADAA